jgi:hypothetical protein
MIEFLMSLFYSSFHSGHSTVHPDHSTAPVLDYSSR